MLKEKSLQWFSMRSSDICMDGMLRNVCYLVLGCLWQSELCRKYWASQSILKWHLIKCSKWQTLCLNCYDGKIEQKRFDTTDFEYLRNYRYINRLRDLYINFKNLNNKFKRNCKFYTFENLKIKNFQVLKKICGFLDVKFN